jgi:hypothetical protein
VFHIDRSFITLDLPSIQIKKLLNSLRCLTPSRFVLEYLTMSKNTPAGARQHHHVLIALFVLKTYRQSELPVTPTTKEAESFVELHVAVSQKNGKIQEQITKVTNVA